MTELMSPTVNAPWSTMPGWNIVADLTPPELIQARALKTLRRLLISALAFVVVLCCAGYVLARNSASDAHDQLDAATARTSVLMAQRSGYAIVTRVRSATESVQGQLVTLFAADIDVANVLQKIRNALPKGMALTTMTVAPNSSVSVGADPSDPTLVQVGTVTLGGTAAALDDLPLFASALGAVKGFADVVPSTNSKGEKSVTWTVSFALTNDLLTKRYTAGGGH